MTIFPVILHGDKMNKSFVLLRSRPVKRFISILCSEKAYAVIDRMKIERIFPIKFHWIFFGGMGVCTVLCSNNSE